MTLRSYVASTYFILFLVRTPLARKAILTLASKGLLLPILKGGCGDCRITTYTLMWPHSSVPSSCCCPQISQLVASVERWSGQLLMLLPTAWEARWKKCPCGWFCSAADNWGGPFSVQQNCGLSWGAIVGVSGGVQCMPLSLSLHIMGLYTLQLWRAECLAVEDVHPRSIRHSPAIPGLGEETPFWAQAEPSSELKVVYRHSGVSFEDNCYFSM